MARSLNCRTYLTLHSSKINPSKFGGDCIRTSCSEAYNFLLVFLKCAWSSPIKILGTALLYGFNGRRELAIAALTQTLRHYFVDVLHPVCIRRLCRCCKRTSRGQITWLQISGVASGCGEGPVVLARSVVLTAA